MSSDIQRKMMSQMMDSYRNLMGFNSVMLNTLIDIAIIGVK